MLPTDVGGAREGPKACAEVVTSLAEADASVAMVYLMHVLTAGTIAAAPRSEALAAVLRDIAGGQRLGAEDADLLVTRDIFPLADAFAAVRAAFAHEHRNANRLASIFNCA